MNRFQIRQFFILSCNQELNVLKPGNLNTESINSELNQIFKNIDALLKASKLKRSNVLKCSIFLKNMDDFEKVNDLYSNFFLKPYPARETVQVSKLPKNANIEISFIAGK